MTTDETNKTWQLMMDTTIKHRTDGGIAAFFSREECAHLTRSQRFEIQEWLIEKGNEMIDSYKEFNYD